LQKRTGFGAKKVRLLGKKTPLFDLRRGYFRPSVYHLRRLKLPRSRLGRVLESGPSTGGCRFCVSSLLALHHSQYRAPVHGQQAGLNESGSPPRRAALQNASPTFAHIAVVAAQALLYCGGGLILRHGGAALRDAHSSTRHVERGPCRASSSPDHDGQSGGLSGQVESKYFGLRAGQAAETIRSKCPGGLRHQ
jgi:hypothetical protein